MMTFNVKFVVLSEQIYCCEFCDVLENVLSPLNYPCLEPTVCASMILVYGVNIQSLSLNVLKHVEWSWVGAVFPGFSYLNFCTSADALDTPIFNSLCRYLLLLCLHSGLKLNWFKTKLLVVFKFLLIFHVFITADMRCLLNNILLTLLVVESASREFGENSLQGGLSLSCRDKAVTPISAVTDGRATPHAVTLAAINAVTSLWYADKSLIIPL